MPTWPVPYSVTRLVQLAKTWTFDSEVNDLPDCDDGAPRDWRAGRRIRDYLRGWRDRHGPDDDPFDDESLEPFHVADVATLYH
jgi:hypothetical protein